jgi:PiT family inorganic phosphate transporter
MNLPIPTAGLWIAPVAMALAFGFSNGFRDSSTIVATVVSTGALSPGAAFGVCATFEFLGAFLVGHAITVTMGRVIAGHGAPTPDQVGLILVAALAAALVWGTISWWRAWPTSNSQALVAGLAGATWVVCSPPHIVDRAKAAVFIVLISSPILGCLISIGVTSLLRRIGEWLTPRARPPTHALHVLACATVSTAHGSNDGQVVAAIVMAALGAWGGVGALPHSTAAVRLSVAAAISAGVLFGGRRILRKLGMKFYRIRIMQGVGSQLSAAATIVACAVAGFPASTTQVVSGSIVGAGVAKNPRSVRWLMVREVALSWVVTLPVTALLAAAVAKVLIKWGGT